MNSRLAFAFTAATAGLALFAHAAEDASTVKTAGFQLKNRSTYTTPEETRAPFWPIGWVKPIPGAVAAAAPVVAKIEIDPDQFAVTSIVLGAPPLAVINGRAYSQGETIRIKPATAKDGRAAPALPPGTRIRVAKITDGSVFLEVAGSYAELPLRRPTISVHKADDAEEDLLKPISER